MKSVDDRETMMRNKRKLKDSEQHSVLRSTKTNHFMKDRWSLKWLLWLMWWQKDKLVLRGGRVQSKIQGDGHVDTDRGNGHQ